MTEIKNFYFDGVKGIVLSNNIVKFNLVNLPTNQSDNDDRLTLVTSFNQFESFVKFLNLELSNMKKTLEQNDIEKEVNKDDEIKDKKLEGKVILSQKSIK